MKGTVRVGAFVFAFALLAAACAQEEQQPPAGGGGLPTKVGAGEGELNLIGWIGYVEDGSTDENFDWVTPFEEESGCQVEVKYGDTSDEMVTLMRQGGGSVYDGVSASGDATNRLIAAGDVAEINVDLIPDFKDVMPSLESPPHNTVDGKHYGVPYMWGANVLAYNTEVVKTAPTSWDITWEADSPFTGKVAAYDSPIFIADAALYLKAHRPDLGITDPYELTEEQLDAAIDLLAQQRPMVGKYWAAAADEIDAFTSGELVVGTAWPYQVSILQGDKQPVDAVIPQEGATGWADTWMMSSNAPHPNCMYKWMQWTMRPEVQAEVAEFYGATPSNAQSCDLLRDSIGEAAGSVYHCGDDGFLGQLALWKTPLQACGDDRGDTCVDYSVWTQRWQEVRGA
ncbi:MAG TPA: ABC transporter substrate-binding protein [Actinomycetota bacterium]|nr:ABC transporter substrate-binding protein [Actinomycetota bacterium]